MKKLLITTAVGAALLSLAACNGKNDTPVAQNTTTDTTVTTTSQGQTTGQKLDDATIVAKVKTKLVDEPNLSALKINVDSTNGAVVLNGTAPTMDSKDRATQLAKEVPNVRSVDNELVVSSTGVPVTQKMADTASNAYSSSVQAIDNGAHDVKERVSETKDDMDRNHSIENTTDKVENSMDRMGHKAEAKIEDATIVTKLNGDLVKDPDLSALKINVDSHYGHVVLRGDAPTWQAKKRATELARATDGVKTVDNELVIRHHEHSDNN